MAISLPDSNDGSLARWWKLVNQARRLEVENNELSERQLELERERDDLAARLATLQTAFPGDELAARRHRLEGLQIEAALLGGKERLDEFLAYSELKLAELHQQIVDKWGVAGVQQYLNEADFTPVDPRRAQMWVIAHAPGPPAPLPRPPGR